MKIIDGYHTIPLKKLQGKPIGTAHYDEPVFKLGIPQNTFIQVTVTLWNTKIGDPERNLILQGVQFGEMNLIRYVPINELYDMKGISQ